MEFNFQISQRNKIFIDPFFSNWVNFIEKVPIINGSWNSKSFKDIFFGISQFSCVHDSFPTVCWLCFRSTGRSVYSETLPRTVRSEAMTSSREGVGRQDSINWRRSRFAKSQSHSCLSSEHQNPSWFYSHQTKDQYDRKVILQKINMIPITWTGRSRLRPFIYDNKGRQVIVACFQVPRHSWYELKYLKTI